MEVIEGHRMVVKGIGLLLAIQAAAGNQENETLHGIKAASIVVHRESGCGNSEEN